MPTVPSILASALPASVQLRQDIETPLTRLTAPFGTLLYLYARSGDSVSSATIGQDYVAFRYGESRLAFAVCDGVGQSFMGDLAARILGDGLVERLWTIDAPLDTASFSQAVTAALNDLTTLGEQQASGFKLPEHLPPIVVQALEMQRDYGSESMFVAGRVELSEPEPWLALCWLGDSPVAAIDIDGELMDLGPQGHTSERWNTSRGVKGQVHSWVGSADRVARVMGYSDGLGFSHAPTDEDLVHVLAEWPLSPPDDDASLFDVRLTSEPQIGAPVVKLDQAVPSPPSEAPEKLEVEAGDEAPAKGKVARAILADEVRADIPAGVADTQPIIVRDEQRTPVSRLEPIDIQPSEEPRVMGWRPLTPDERLERQQEPPGMTREQQLHMWQQAALLGLTSAALALLMLDRLLAKEDR